MASSPIECVFFDCDDCLYKNKWATAAALNAKFGAYCEDKLGVSNEEMLELYRTHGTTLCGLVREGHLDEQQVDDFLVEVHNISYDDIQPDPELRKMIQRIPHKRWVFTAAIREHAEMCLKRLGIDDLFLGIVACSSQEIIGRVGYVSKHDPRCFEAAMDIAGIDRSSAATCMLLDDSASNLKTAKAIGWRTVLVGLHNREGLEVLCPSADVKIDLLHDLPRAVPELFLEPQLERVTATVTALGMVSGAAASTEHVFFDCDDCLYKNNWATAAALNAKFGEYCENKLGVTNEKMLQLYRTYGTTLCGLVREGYLNEMQVDDFLAKVHDIPYDDIQPDPELRNIIKAIPHRRWVFTAAIREHAEKCLKRLGIDDLFLGIVACSSREMIERVGYVSKHDPSCFDAAMDFAGVDRSQTASCMLLDDSASNIKTAKAMGWRTVLVGLRSRDGSEVACSSADVKIDTLHELPRMLPRLFGQPHCIPTPKTLVAATVSESLSRPRGTKRDRQLKPFVSSPCRRVLRRASTPQVLVHANAGA